MKEAAETFQQSLAGDALAYLERRGLAKVARQVGLGFVPGNSDATWERYRGMLSIPYYTADGSTVVSIRFRKLNDNDGRPK